MVYEELMAAVNAGSYKELARVGNDRYYLVAKSFDFLAAVDSESCFATVGPDGRCYINGVYDPDAPDFLQAITTAQHARALAENG